MTITTDQGRVPQVTLGWRLKLALGDMQAGKMADELGYSRQQVSRWMNDDGIPRSSVLAQWALITGVSRAWLETGVTPVGDDPEGLPRLDSNQQPSGKRLSQVIDMFLVHDMAA
jgi:transcriptional regulator with XRE-family HTH domain